MIQNRKIYHLVLTINLPLTNSFNHLPFSFTHTHVHAFKNFHENTIQFHLCTWTCIQTVAKIPVNFINAHVHVFKLSPKYQLISSMRIYMNSNCHKNAVQFHLCTCTCIQTVTNYQLVPSMHTCVYSVTKTILISTLTPIASSCALGYMAATVLATCTLFRQKHNQLFAKNQSTHS